MVEQLGMLGLKASNSLLMAPFALRNAIRGGIGMMFDDGGGGVGVLDVNEILEGAGDTMQDGGSFSEVSEKVDSIGGGAYHVIYKVGIFLGLFAIIIVGISLMFANANERQEKKSKLIWVIVGCAIMMGACALLLFISKLSNGMFV